MNLDLIATSDNLYSLVDKTQPLEIIASEHLFTEGPVWDEKNNRLLFSDIPADTIYQWDEISGKSIYRKPSHFANGLVYDHEGNLIICEHQGRAITMDNGGDEVQVLADSFNSFKLNSPNDVIVAPDGSIIFTDPIYGLRPGNGGPAEQELPFQGVYRIPADRKSLILITDSFERPNGLAISPINNKLYIADTVRQHIRVFDFDEEWQMNDDGVWAELVDDDYVGRPDGMKFDHMGNLFSTGPGGVWIFDQTANLLGRIILPDKTSNLAWGDADKHTLFITSSDKVYRLRCRTHGVN